MGNTPPIDDLEKYKNLTPKRPSKPRRGYDPRFDYRDDYAINSF